MAINKLTDTKIKAAKPTGKLFKLFDGGGLFLAVLPTGGKSWRVTYKIADKMQTATLGMYPIIGLADARGLRDELKRKITLGEPVKTKKRNTLTLAQCMDAYYAGRLDLTAQYLANARRGIELHLTELLNTPIADIDRDQFLAPLVAADAAGKHVYARKVRMWAHQIWAWAVEHGHATVNVPALVDPKRAFGRATVESFQALDLRDVPAFMQRLDLEGNLQSVLACKLLALTWVRTNELRMMMWAEIDGDTWRIPAGKMKRRREHLVPLCAQALALLDELGKRARGSVYVFPADHRQDRPISENAILALLYRLGYKGKRTGHGWRTVASTWANERGYRDDAIELQLAHAPDDGVRAVYNRAKLLPERRKMMQDYADWLFSF